LIPTDPIVSIIIGCQNNDRNAQKQLFELYSGRMMTLCRGFADDTMEADDFLQEGFIKVFTKIKQYKFEGSYDGWIRKVFLTTILRLISKKKKLMSISIDDSNPTNEIYDENIFYDLDVEEILNMISTLPKGYRTIFNLHEIEGYSHKEIAQILKIEEASSRSQLSKAKNALKSFYNKLHNYYKPS
jgi:RNA polymerase sigma factor (sigma-70 family)